MEGHKLGGRRPTGAVTAVRGWSCMASSIRGGYSQDGPVSVPVPRLVIYPPKRPPETQSLLVCTTTYHDFYSSGQRTGWPGPNNLNTTRRNLLSLGYHRFLPFSPSCVAPTSTPAEHLGQTHEPAAIPHSMSRASKSKAAQNPTQQDRGMGTMGDRGLCPPPSSSVCTPSPWRFPIFIPGEALWSLWRR
ncbi:hypothetical protein LZ30DRAFT_7297 [Colletotrichum cereale]|nr:hypothetical protein LZ30DRAFT_7297 [Colletotrichum cereale]